MDTSRRNFLKWIWGVLGVAAVMEVLVIVATFFTSNTVDKEDNGLEDSLTNINVGLVPDFQPGSVTVFTRGRFYLARLKNGGFLALSSQCTHLGCSLLWNEEKQEFICPCHASRFDISGKVVSTPAPRPLDLYDIHITNSSIVVDTSARIQRHEFQPDQVSFPDKIGVTES